MPDSVSFSGPVFDSRGSSLSDALTQKIEDTIAEKGMNLVYDRLQQVLRVNHHVYDSHLRTDRSSEGNVINDGGMIYGPWLEGTGSRNQTTRFKGYFTFRQATQEIDEQSTGYISGDIDDYVRGLNS